MKKIFFSLALLSLLIGIFSVFSVASAQDGVLAPKPTWNGLVPCGRSGTGPESKPCTLCHFIVGFQRLVQYTTYLVSTLAFVAIFFAGVMYIISAGDEEMMRKAKAFLKAALTGFAIVAGSWLIIDITLWVVGVQNGLGIGVTNWYTFTCIY